MEASEPHEIKTMKTVANNRMRRAPHIAPAAA
jgi:hypothetical protein